jgi:hypothetical protein
MSTSPRTSNFKLLSAFRLASISHPPKHRDGGLGTASSPASSVDAKPLGVLFTNEILPELHKRDDRPWPEYGKKQLPITSRQVASLLKPFEIPTNQTVWRGTATSAKGYRREDFEDAFARYLPPPMGEP